MMTLALRGSMASLASVLLVLSAIVMLPSFPSTGIPVIAVARSAYPAGVACVLQHLVIVRVEPDHRLYINSEPVTLAALPNRLEMIFRTRAERAAFVLGSPELPYADVAQILAAVRPVVKNIGILTPKSVPTLSEPLLVRATPAN